MIAPDGPTTPPVDVTDRMRLRDDLDAAIAASQQAVESLTGPAIEQVDAAIRVATECDQCLSQWAMGQVSELLAAAYDEISVLHGSMVAALDHRVWRASQAMQAAGVDLGIPPEAIGSPSQPQPQQVHHVAPQTHVPPVSPAPSVGAAVSLPQSVPAHAGPGGDSSSGATVPLPVAQTQPQSQSQSQSPSQPPCPPPVVQCPPPEVHVSVTPECHTVSPTAQTTPAPPATQQTQAADTAPPVEDMPAVPDPPAIPESDAGVILPVGQPEYLPSIVLVSEPPRIYHSDTASVIVADGDLDHPKTLEFSANQEDFRDKPTISKRCSKRFIDALPERLRIVRPILVRIGQYVALQAYGEVDEYYAPQVVLQHVDPHKETHGFALNPRVLRDTIAKYYAGKPRDVVSDVCSALLYGIQTGLAKLFVNWLWEYSGKIGSGRDSDLKSLMACERFLMMLDSLELTTEGGYDIRTSHTDVTTYGASLGLGLQLQSGTGAGGTGAKSDQRLKMDGVTATSSIKTTTRPYLLPLIEACRQLIRIESAPEGLTADQAISAYIRGAITWSDAVCYCGAQGLGPAEAQRLALTAATVPNVSDTIALYFRGKIDVSTMSEMLRKNGILSKRVADWYLELARYVPGPSDLIRFMVRDTEDIQIVRDFDLDAEFSLKYRDYVKDALTAQGIDRDTALRYWRSHWDLPSPHQVYECVHRLRPDAVPAVPRDIQTTPEIVRTYLAQSDMLPFWRDRLIALSYSPLTRVDAQRAFTLGVIDADRLRSAYQDLGYTRADAETLVKYSKIARAKFLAQTQAVRAYREGAVTADEAMTQLRQYAVTDDEAQAALSIADTQLRSRLRRRCIAALRRRFLAGDLDRHDADLALKIQGISGLNRRRYIESWECELAARGKVTGAATLCRWYRHGLLTEPELLERLLTLGYSDSDARRIVRTCQAETQRWKQRERVAAERSERAAAAQARREQAARERRESRVRRSKSKLAKLTGASYDDASAAWDESFSWLVREGYEDSEAVQVMVDVIAGLPRKIRLAELSEHVEQVWKNEQID